MALCYGMGRNTPYIKPILNLDPRLLNPKSWNNWYNNINNNIDTLIGILASKMELNEKTKMTLQLNDNLTNVDDKNNENHNYSAFLYKDEESYVYVIISDDTYRDDHVFQFLAQMRSIFRIYSRNSTDINLFFNDEKCKSSLIAALPNSIQRTNSFVYEVSKDNVAECKVVSTKVETESRKDYTFLDTLCSADGLLWRGAGQELYYRLCSDSTLFIPCGVHDQLSTFARILLAIHSLVALFFLCVVIITSVEEYEADPGTSMHRVNSYMDSHYVLLSGVAGGVIAGYIQVIRYILVNSLLENESRQEGLIKSFFTFFERIGHIPLALISCLALTAGLAGLAIYQQSADAGTLFMFSICFFMGAFVLHILSRYLPTISCGWNSAKNYFSLFTCCTWCKWVPDSAFGLCMTEHCYYCAPSPTDGTTDIPCCLLSYPCCTAIPTQCCDEFCFPDTPLDKILFWCCFFFSTTFFGIGIIVLFASNVLNVYDTTAYILKCTGLGWVFYLAAEIGWMILSLVIGVILRCFVELYLDLCDCNNTDSSLPDPDNSTAKNNRG